MSQYVIETDGNFTTKVEVRSSDAYSGNVYMKIDRHYIPEEVRACNEMFMSADELEQLGMFLVEQAKMIRRK